MKLGFIGAGNMAQAMIGGVLGSGLLQKDDIIASAATQNTIEKVQKQYGIRTTLNNREAAGADIVFLAVKPAYCGQVIEEIKDTVSEQQVIVSIRTMPNTPALVGEGITAVCPNDNISTEELQSVCKILESFGRAEVIQESMMDAVIAVSGSSPAYVFLFIEAMADAAVAEGMPRATAYQFAAQSVLGSARMVLETGKHPGELKDMVCSPAGTTIEAVRVLEREGLRGSVMECMRACADKSRNM